LRGTAGGNEVTIHDEAPRAEKSSHGTVEDPNLVLLEPMQRQRRDNYVKALPGKHRGPRLLSDIGQNPGDPSPEAMQRLPAHVEKNRIGVYRNNGRPGKTSQDLDGKRSGPCPEFEHPEHSAEVSSKYLEHRLHPFHARRVDCFEEHWIPPLEEVLA
jgi:hypothetical protein